MPENARVPRATRARTATTTLAASAALAAVFADEPARWLVVADPPRPADAALVLAGDPDYERTKSGARLQISGEVRLLILTGGEPGPGDSASSLREVALRLGVPAAAIRMEQVSRSTHESMLAIRPILALEGVRTLVVVTSPYHQRRAVWAARRTLPEVAIVSRPADPAGWRPAGWWKTAWNRRIVLGEYLRLTYYILRGWA
jgi:uncharacterized SAM-binding protein YcdF (DUF218 family)